MRAIGWLVVTLGIFAAGCLEPSSSPKASTPADPAPAGPVWDALPANVSRSIPVVVAFDVPLPVGDEEFCWMPTRSCAEERFTLGEGASNTTLDVEVRWSGAANNFGVFLYQGAEIVDADSGPTPSGQRVAFRHKFEKPGEYRIVVDAHIVAADTAVLRASFSRA